jgi:16S rRNA (guanine527-N7)-methyltransferase
MTGDMMTAEWQNMIAEGAKVLGIHIEKENIGQFAVHAAELLRWNKRTNLTAITVPAEIAVKHFVDSIAPAPLIPPNSSLLDIGSGGGFPGIPLKIMIPSLSVMLIDASRKKVSFQKHVIRTLNLSDIEARHVRAEEIAEDFSNFFDVILCRALSSLEDFISMSVPLLKKDGLMIALKGKEAEKETAAAQSKIRAAQLSLTVKKYNLPYLGAERSLICLKRS